jgi:sugar phosphate isomerase/epimerase
MFDIIPSGSFGLTYDPSHLLWQQMDYIKPIYEFKDKIFYVHVKDAKVYKDKLNEVGIMATPLEFHSPKLPGLGDVNWGKFISALTDIRYTSSVCIEVEDKAFENSLEDKQKALLLSKKYIGQYI